MIMQKMIFICKFDQITFLGDECKNGLHERGIRI